VPLDVQNRDKMRILWRVGFVREKKKCGKMGVKGAAVAVQWRWFGGDCRVFGWWDGGLVGLGV
jgi:hypothetical protein